VCKDRPRDRGRNYRMLRKSESLLDINGNSVSSYEKIEK